MTLPLAVLVLMVGSVSIGCATFSRPRTTMPVQARIHGVPMPFRALSGLTSQQKERYFRYKRISLGTTGPVVGTTPCAWEELPYFLKRSGAVSEAEQLSRALDKARLLDLHPDRPIAAPSDSDRQGVPSLLRAIPFLELAVQAELKAPLQTYNQRLAKALNQSGPLVDGRLDFSPPPPMNSAFSDGLFKGEDPSMAEASYTVFLQPNRNWSIGATGVTDQQMVEFIKSQMTVAQIELPHFANPIYQGAGWIAGLGAISFMVGMAVAIPQVDSNGYHGPAWAQSALIYGGAGLLIGMPVRMAFDHSQGSYGENLNRIALEHNQAVRENFLILKAKQ